tara:strand:+ start:2766 stop:2930 length:165 start_codon:yes stop_codon:yes gene_type:complete
MSDKDIRKLERAMERVVREVLEIEPSETETMFPVSVIDEIEEWLGEPIYFMGIS